MSIRYFEPEVTPYSYTVWTSGGVYYARNNSTNVVSSGTLFSTLMNAVIDALNSGTIFIRAGTYVVDAKIDITGTQEIIIRGEGKYSTILDCRSTTGNIGLEVGDTSNICSEFGLYDLNLWGTAGTTKLLYIMCTRFPVVFNVYFLAYQYGLHLSSESDQSCLFANIQSCDFVGEDTANATAGLFIDGGGAFTCNDNIIIGCRFYSSVSGAQVDYGYNNTFQTCDFEACATGLYLGPNYARYTTVINSNFESNTTLDLDIDAGASNNHANKFIDCSFRSAATVDDDGWYSRFDNCTGFKTMNSGAATGTGLQQTIAHGLNAIPDVILLCNQNWGATAEPQITAAADATNIYITATNTKPYTWVASYHFFGGAGFP